MPSCLPLAYQHDRLLVSLPVRDSADLNLPGANPNLAEGVTPVSSQFVQVCPLLCVGQHCIAFTHLGIIATIFFTLSKWLPSCRQPETGTLSHPDGEQIASRFDRRL